MSILNVEHLSHGFGDRAIFEDVSFRLLKGEHIGLVGANGEGKSTFMNIITGKLMPDEGKVEWAKNVRVGYLDQHTVLEKGMTIRDVLKSAFSWLYEMEERMNTICDSMGDASEDELNQRMHMTSIFWIPESKRSAARLALKRSVSNAMSPNFPADRERRYFWQNYFWKNRTSFFWMSRPTTWMWNISPG